jgi:hypothetical protein
MVYRMKGRGCWTWDGRKRMNQSGLGSCAAVDYSPSTSTSWLPYGFTHWNYRFNRFRSMNCFDGKLLHQGHRGHYAFWGERKCSGAIGVCNTLNWISGGYQDMKWRQEDTSVIFAFCEETKLREVFMMEGHLTVICLLWYSFLDATYHSFYYSTREMSEGSAPEASDWPIFPLQSAPLV